jgi:DNA-binding response OmpR family regulator
MSAQNKLILVVDDDPGILEALQALLTYAGYEVITDTGETLYEKIQTYQPDLLLLDILLSGQDGREITKRLKSQKETRHLPIILLSAHLHAATDAQIFGADDFVPKPFKMGDLLAKIVKYL